jgi:hypothetical protein
MRQAAAKRVVQRSVRVRAENSRGYRWLLMDLRRYVMIRD